MELLALAILVLLTVRYAGVWFGLGLGLGVGMLWLSIEPVTALPKAPLETPEKRGLETSKACRSCHPSAWASWHESYHRTMTQRADAATVLADFDMTLTEAGVSWVLSRSDDGFFVSRRQENQAPQVAQITLLTGSHHMQNYWMDLGKGWLVQFPWSWWIAQSRWIPVSASFLQPPDEPDVPVVWNDSCIYCHTTQGIRGSSTADTETRSTVGELGIACESCHGPAAQHVDAVQNPLNRYQARNTDAVALKIVNPERLRERSDGVCGQCHGVFVHREGASRSVEGDSYRPGHDIEKTRLFVDLSPTEFSDTLPMMMLSTPVAVKGPGLPAGCTATGFSPEGLLLSCASFAAGRGIVSIGSLTLRGTHRSGESRSFFLADLGSPGLWSRALTVLGLGQVPLSPKEWDAFWRDGTIRTVGREYNGLQASACAPQLRCVSCHSMHDSEPNDQLRAGAGGDEACRDCHQSYVSDPESHTHHPPDSSGSRCQNCHMPHTTYGLLGASRSHRVDVPSPVWMDELGRPNACNLCHLDETIQWAEDAVSRWFKRPARADRSAAAAIPALPRWVLSGDAAMRAVATWHLGWAPARETASVQRWAAPYLIESLGDEYAAVRAIAEQVLRAVVPEVPYRYERDQVAKPDVIKRMMSHWRSENISETSLIDARGRPTHNFKRLRARRDRRPVTIAE